MKNIVLFPGSFDPIHNGHVEMAKMASTLLNAEVIFIPAVISVWKSSSVSYKDKVNMLALAIEGIEHLSIDTYESTTGNDINYSIDTIKYFKKKFPKDNLYLLIGEDQVNEFHRWKSADEIAKLTQIIFFERPYIADQKENVVKFNMCALEGVFSTATSSNVRNLHDLDVPRAVIDYIAKNDLYYFEKIKTFLKEKRLNHSKVVALLAYDIAKNNNINVSKAYIAGILHDIGKEVEEVEKDEIMASYYPEFVSLPRFSYHQFVGEYIAKNIFGITDSEILNAIKFHATGNDDMDSIAKIVYSSDKIDPTRGYDSSDLIKGCYENLDLGFIKVLDANRDHLRLKNKDINNELTIKCFDKFLGK